MTNTPFREPPRFHLQVILRRVAVPLAIFAGVLFGLLLISWYMLLPRFTRVAVSGSLLDAAALQTYKAQLTHTVETEEAARDELVLPLQDATFDALKAQRRDGMTLSMLRTQVEEQAKSLSPEVDAIHLERFGYLIQEKRLTLTGDVRNVGTRSMTLLANFVEALKHLSFVDSLAEPPFSREDTPGIGLHSPFTFTITLR